VLISNQAAAVMVRAAARLGRLRVPPLLGDETLRS
jgi:hypothetical protein